mmetsp:Transcript_33188/g.91458  ORF Transcript_33188/g.91458 Transcript_33188/m.91458 type:complete len:295 (-) Transcript_33188:1000-1884(-)
MHLRPEDAQQAIREPEAQRLPHIREVEILLADDQVALEGRHLLPQYEQVLDEEELCVHHLHQRPERVRPVWQRPLRELPGRLPQRVDAYVHGLLGKALERRHLEDPVDFRQDAERPMQRGEPADAEARRRCQGHSRRRACLGARGGPHVGGEEEAGVIQIHVGDLVAPYLVPDIGLNAEDELLLNVLVQSVNHSQERHDVAPRGLLLVRLEDVHLKAIRNLPQRVGGSAREHDRPEGLVEDVRDSFQQCSQRLLRLPELEVRLKALAFEVRYVQDVRAGLPRGWSQLAGLQLGV